MRLFGLAAIVLTACSDTVALDSDASLDAGLTLDAAVYPDAFMPSEDAAIPELPHVAPQGFVGGELTGVTGDNAVSASTTESAIFRVETVPGEHVGFFLRYADTYADVTLSVDRFGDDGAAHEFWYTDGGRGIRTIAVFEDDGPRTYWVRVDAMETAFTGTLTIVRTPFSDGATCTADCSHLLQLPVPVDADDGYTLTPSTILRYQFGRRDLLMFVRNAGRTMRAAGYAPFRPEDFSQWDGLTPGSDTGNLRHASHQRGKDVDLSLYGTDGLAPFRSYCTTVTSSDGRACAPGTVQGFDGYANARFYASFLATGRVTMSFLDAELIPFVRAGATAGVADHVIPMSLLALYSDGVHLQHWPNHDNHIHVRVSEALYPMPGARIRVIPEPFEAP